MDNASQRGLLGNTSGEEALNCQLQFLRESLLKALEAIESIRAAYIPQSDQKQQLDEAVQRFEASLLRAALVRTRGNKNRAAMLLGVKVTTFHAKLKRHKIHHDESVGGRSL